MDWMESVKVRDIVHHGIKGQKWGVQNGPPYPLDESDKSERERTLNRSYDEKQILMARGKDGKLLTMEQIDKSLIAKGLAKISKSIYKNQMNDKNFDIKIGDKVIGNLELYQDSPTEVNGVWLGIDEEYRGNGYATAVLMTALHECRERGYKTFTIEVPEISPDAHHIYRKLGFVDGEKISEDDIWGGLTKMTLDLTKYDF